MSKRPSLFGANAAKPREAAPAPAAPVPPPVPVALPEPPAPPAGAVDAARKYPIAKTREGKRVATVYLEPEGLRQLKRVAFDEDKTVQELLVEGINAVFEKRGLSRIA